MTAAENNASVPATSQHGSSATSGSSASSPASPSGSSDVGANAVTQQSVFQVLGGEEGVRALVDRFYDLMDLEPDLADLRALHPTDLEGSRDKLFWFLCGWLGGPDYFVQRFGHPRLRARHLPYAIDSHQRDLWLVCMGRAMQEQGIEEPLFGRLLESFYGTADWMRNRPD